MGLFISYMEILQAELADRAIGHAPGRSLERQAGNARARASARSGNRKALKVEATFMSKQIHDPWPSLDYGDWKATCQTLHLWSQIVGKIRLAKSPWVNHSWHVTLYVSPRGLTTGAMPDGHRQFEIEFDFIDHRLVARESSGRTKSLPLVPMSVADFYSELMAMLGELDIDVRINEIPNEVADPIPFSRDSLHAYYDAAFAERFWRVLLQVHRVFTLFRSRFSGKCSPVHFFWGSFDLAVTRFSGRTAPLHPGGVPNLPDNVAREAYCQEVSSAGFWPGGGGIDYPAFYSYAYPAAPGFSRSAVRPEAAFFSEALGEFILPYQDVRIAPDPDACLMAFLQSTYDAAVRSGDWPKDSLLLQPLSTFD